MLSPATAHHSCQVAPRARPSQPGSVAGAIKLQPVISPSHELLQLSAPKAHPTRSSRALQRIPLRRDGFSSPLVLHFGLFFFSTESNKLLYERCRKWVGERERQKQRHEDIKPQLKSSSSLMRTLGIKAHFSIPQESCEPCSVIIFIGDR